MALGILISVSLFFLFLDLSNYNDTTVETHVLLDMFEIRTILECGSIPILVLEPGIDVGIVVSDRAEVAFEVVLVDCVEADDCCVGADIELGEVCAQDVRASVGVKDFFENVECAEHGDYVFVVGFLVGC